MSYRFVSKLLRRKEFLFLLVCFTLSLNVNGQKVVSGTVKSEAGVPISGVSVTATDDISIGTTTDASGNYRLKLPAGKTTLTLSSIGYLSQDVSVNNRDVVNIVLNNDQMNLNEVVVTGYSTQQKKDITGSVAVVDMKAMNSIPAGSAMDALQGMAAGVDVISSGVPGAARTIFIRGISSFGNTQPLILIDGVEAALNGISTDEIESIQVLKDAGAASIYGVRGSNGVIIVTTKKGKTGAPIVSYHGYVGNQVPTKGNALNTLNSEEYAKMYKIAFPNTTLFANGLPDYIYGGPNGRGFGMAGDPAVDPSKYVLDLQTPSNDYIIQKVNKEGTDWFHELFKPAIMTSHNISASGGTDRSNYLFSLGYVNEQGTVIESFQKRYTARINTQFKLPGNIRIGENVAIMNWKGSGFRNNADYGPIYELYQMLPIIPLYDIEGNFGSTVGAPAEAGISSNPIAQQKSHYNDNHEIWNIIGNTYAEVDFLKDFTARSSFGINVQNRADQYFTPSQYWEPNYYTQPNILSVSAGNGATWTWTNSLTYAHEVGKHKIKLLGGSEAIKNSGRDVGGSSKNFFATNFDYLILGNGTTNVTNYSSGYSDALFSLFSRLDYSYDDKYLIGATVRRDGSSRFGSNNRYGTFPSYSLGWRINNENFMKNVSWINELKLRASYGILGSQNNIGSTNAFTLFGSSFGSGYDITGSSNSVRQGFYQTNIGNPSIQWEKDIISNVGIDLAMLNKFSLSLDFYKKSIEGLLFPKPLPATAGGASAPYVNIGDIQNRGVDVTAKYFNSFINQKLRLTVSANVTTYNNLVKRIPAPGYFDAASQQQIGNLVRNQEGHAVSSFFGYDVIALFNSDDDVLKSPTQTDAAPGRFKYRDVDGDGEITTKDRTFLGSPNPDFTYSLNLNLEFEGFDFSAFFYGNQGSEIINTLKSASHFWPNYITNKSRDLLNAWTPTNTNTTIPKIETLTTFSTVSVMNSSFVEDGSYLRLKSLMLGYSIKSGALEKIGFNKVRLYAQAANLFTITKYSGLDPELTGSSAAFGLDFGNYPHFKNYVLGIDISF